MGYGVHESIKLDKELKASIKEYNKQKKKHNKEEAVEMLKRHPNYEQLKPNKG